MKQAWVDCYIDKLLQLFPDIHSYTAMIDRWAFKPIWDEQTVDSDFSRVLSTEAQLIGFYGIRRSFEEGWIDEALRSGCQVLLPCDLYYMPHAKVFFGKEHAGHYILVQNLLDGNRYQIFDDHPAFIGDVDRTTIQTAHHALGQRHQVFEPGMLPVSEAAAACYMSSMLKPDSFYLGDFARRLLDGDESPRRKCQILLGTRHLYHRIQGFVRLLETAPLTNQAAEEAVLLRSEVAKYMDEWRVTVNLASRALLQFDDRVWGRVEERLVKHLNEESVLPSAAARFLEIWAAVHPIEA